MLAMNIYPEPEGTEYTAEQLKDVETVKELFDACQILEAIITEEGWADLIDEFGIEKLFEIDRQSGWHDAETADLYFYEMLADDAFAEGYLVAQSYKLYDLLGQELTVELELIPKEQGKSQTINEAWIQVINLKYDDKLEPMTFHFKEIDESLYDAVFKTVNATPGKHVHERIIEEFCQSIVHCLGEMKCTWHFAEKNPGIRKFFIKYYHDYINVVVLEFEGDYLMIMLGV